MTARVVQSIGRSLGWRARSCTVPMAALLCLMSAGCTFDSTVEAWVPVLGNVVIHDPAPTGTDCAQRAQEMMWLIHLYDAEATPRYPGLPLVVNAGIQTPNGVACEYTGSILVRVPEHMPTMKWFVMAMDESDWVAECSTSLLTHAGPDGPLVPVGRITFVRGQSGCTVGGS